MAFGNYSFKNVNVVYGISEVQGFAEGDDVVNIDFNADQFTLIVGAKGDATRTQTSDNSALIVIKVLQTSPSYKELLTQYNLDRETGANVLPLVVVNKDTGELFVGNNAWIVKPPQMIRGQNANAVEFTFATDFGTMTIL